MVVRGRALHLWCSSPEPRDPQKNGRGAVLSALVVGDALGVADETCWVLF